MSLSDFFGLLFPGSRLTVGFAKRRGRRDASDELPVWESAEAIAERLLSAGEVWVEYPKIPRTRNKLVEWIGLKQRQYLGYMSELRNVVEEALSDTMARIHREDARLKAQWISIKLRLMDAESDLDEFDELYPGYPRGRSVSMLFYLPFLVLVAVADVPFNMFAFRIFRENELFTIAVAIVVGTVIPVTAHWIGVCLRQPVRNQIDRALMSATFFFVFVAVLGIGIVREAYLKSENKHSDLSITVLFVTLQYLFFALATYLAKRAHDARDMITERIASYSRLCSQVRTRREKLRDEKFNEFKQDYSMANILLGKYAEANINAGGPCSRFRVPSVKVERVRENVKQELHEVDEDMPPELLVEALPDGPPEEAVSSTTESEGAKDNGKDQI
jgi:hypothetical protein